MAQELKHAGRIKATNKKVLIAYRTLPGDAYNCLVIPTENLNDQYHNALINLVESSTAQQAYEFAEALDRTQFPDGSRMLPSLHSKGLLIKVSTDAVEMTPTPGFSVLLSELNQIIAEQRGVAVDGLSIAPSLVDKVATKKLPVAAAVVAADPLVADPTDTLEDQAKFYRSQADKLAKESAAMRRKAEELVPTKKTK